jgi:hypothetical protein
MGDQPGAAGGDAGGNLGQSVCPGCADLERDRARAKQSAGGRRHRESLCEADLEGREIQIEFENGRQRSLANASPKQFDRVAPPGKGAQGVITWRPAAVAGDQADSGSAGGESVRSTIAGSEWRSISRSRRKSRKSGQAVGGWSVKSVTQVPQASSAKSAPAGADGRHGSSQALASSVVNRLTSTVNRPRGYPQGPQDIRKVIRRVVMQAAAMPYGPAMQGPRLSAGRMISMAPSPQKAARR